MGVQRPGALSILGDEAHVHPVHLAEDEARMRALEGTGLHSERVHRAIPLGVVRGGRAEIEHHFLLDAAQIEQLAVVQIEHVALHAADLGADALDALGDDQGLRSIQAARLEVLRGKVAAAQVSGKEGSSAQYLIQAIAHFTPALDDWRFRQDRFPFDDFHLHTFHFRHTCHY